MLVHSAYINLTKGNTMNTDTILMTQAQAAQYLGTTVGTLNSWRHYGKNTIPFVRWGNRIRYRKADLDTWIENNLHNPTP